MRSEHVSGKCPKRLVLRRSEYLEALLQRLWTLRPEYEGKIALTVFSALNALIREIERTDSLTSKKRSHARTAKLDQKSASTELVVINPDSEWN